MVEKLKYLGYSLNEFNVVDAEKLPKMVVKEWGRGSEATVTLCIKYTEDTHFFFNLMDDDNIDNKEWYQELADEFNEEATQETWDEYRILALKNVIEYYKKDYVETKNKISKITQQMYSLENK